MQFFVVMVPRMILYFGLWSLGVRSDFQSLDCMMQHDMAQGTEPLEALVPAPKSRNSVPQPSETQLPCFKYGVLHKTWT